MEPIITLEHVNFWYNHQQENQTQALKNINLEIFPGEYVAFFGPSGSGKTTLLYLLSGIEQSQQGTILIRGKNIAEFSKQELAIYRQVGVGMIFQQFNLIPTLSVLDNVSLPMAFLGTNQSTRKAEAMRLLERLDMQQYANRFPHELSGGQQQRVGIARAMANNAPIIIADEPLGNLDSENSNRVMAFLKTLNEKDKRTIIMVTHEAWSLKDVQKIFYIKDGEIKKTEIGSKNLVKSVSQHLFGEMHPELSSTEVAARSLSNLFLRGYSPEEISTFEKALLKRMNKKINAEQFRYEIDKPLKDGGVGLWWPKVMKISNYVENIITEQKKIDEAIIHFEKNPELPYNQEIENIGLWLADSHKFQDQDWVNYLEGVKKRLKRQINQDEFLSFLKSSKRGHGLGLNYKLAFQISEKFELALKNKELPISNQ